MTYRSKTMCLIFSKDRPMQLLATLDTMKKHITDLDSKDVFVLYKTSDKRYRDAYEKLKKEVNCNFIEEKQGSFKKTSISLLSCAWYSYTLFLTDDTVILKDFSLADITTTLNTHSTVIGFSLRLGENTEFCYMHDKLQDMGDDIKHEKDKIIWNWTRANHDFAYPLEISSSLYKRVFALHILRNCEYENPNTMEFKMDSIKQIFSSIFPHLVSYKTSRAVSIPANLTQNIYKNKHTGKDEMSTYNLLKLFEHNNRIDISMFENLRTNGAHYETVYKFCSNI